MTLIPSISLFGQSEIEAGVNAVRTERERWQGEKENLLITARDEREAILQRWQQGFLLFLSFSPI